MQPTVVYDFHVHTFLSDGVLLPIELLRRCVVKGFGGLVLADHSSASTLPRVIEEGARDCALARQYWGLECYAGVELTHCPAGSIPDLARQAKALGAALVVVHGESPVEPVEPGTNLVAAGCTDVDVLAHPGLITPQTAEVARETGVLVEITARQGHGMANGHVVRVALEAGAGLVVNSDTHRPDDMLTPEWALHVARCAGVPDDLLEVVLLTNPRELMCRARENAARAGLA
jgi:histidinol phosphatase-like PHP family hydrolase